MQNEDFIKRFEAKQLEKKSKNTVSAYISDIHKFIEYLQGRKLTIEQVTNEIVEEYKTHLSGSLNQRTDKRISPKTVNRNLVSINRFIIFLNCQDDFTGKIFVEINTIKIQNQYYLEDLLEKNELVRMIEKAADKEDDKALAIFKTLYYTGARVSEMLTITPRQIKNDEMMVIGKGKKMREVILADDLVDILNNYIKKMHIKDDDRIFPMTRQTVHYHIKRYAGMCRINLKHASAHKFRHLYAIDLLDNDATLEEVADALGHSNINTARIYTKKTKKELRKTVNKLSIRRNNP